jgi:GNAT superfamily N-acetyltransferase
VFGALAFCGEEPVGWCCVGPRADFIRLERVRALQTDWSERTWSVTCFYIPAKWRHQGVATALLAEAVRVAKSNGAKELEGYPVVPYSQDKDIPAAFAWTGVPRIFEKMKFVEITLPDGTRPIYRKKFR